MQDVLIPMPFDDLRNGDDEAWRLEFVSRDQAPPGANSLRTPTHKLCSVWNPVVFGALEFHRTRHESTCRGCSNTGEDPTKHCYTSDALIQELSELSLMKEFSPSEPNSVMPDSPTGIGADACRATVQ